MGYTTEFEGSISLDRPASTELMNFVNCLARTRRMKRNVEQIKEMDSSGLVEFSNGTYSLWENGDFSQVNKESYEEYRSRIVSDIGQLQILFQQNCGFEPIVFTYPDGTFSDNSKRLVKNLGFTAAISTDSKKHSFDPKTKADPYRLKRYERAGFENISNLIE